MVCDEVVASLCQGFDESKLCGVKRSGPVIPLAMIKANRDAKFTHIATTLHDIDQRLTSEVMEVWAVVFDVRTAEAHREVRCPILRRAKRLIARTGSYTRKLSLYLTKNPGIK